MDYIHPYIYIMDGLDIYTERRLHWVSIEPVLGLNAGLKVIQLACQ